jgi:hypothetical protein
LNYGVRSSERTKGSHGSVLPVADGSLTSRNLKGATGGILEVGSNLPRHTRGARAMPEERLDSDKVLTGLIQEGLGGAERQAARHA